MLVLAMQAGRGREDPDKAYGNRGAKSIAVSENGSL
jgi:hypothetical protein